MGAFVPPPLSSREPDTGFTPPPLSARDPAQTPIEHFGSKMVEGSGLLSAAAHPLDTLKSLSGYDEIKKTVDAYQSGDYKTAATQFLSWAMQNPGTRAAASLVDTSREQLGKAIQAYKDGDYPLVISHGGAALIPVLKPLAEAAELSKKGDLIGAGGLISGEAFDLLAPKVASDYGPAVVSGTRGAASATADNLTRMAAEHPLLLKGLGASGGATVGGAAGSAVGLGSPGALVGGYVGREVGAALSKAAKAKIPPPFPDTPPPLPATPPSTPNPAANVDYGSIPGVGPRPPAPPPPVDPALDAIAQRLGAKDYASGGKALQQMADQIKQGQDAANAARAAQPVPQPLPQVPAPTVPSAAAGASAGGLDTPPPVAAGRTIQDQLTQYLDAQRAAAPQAGAAPGMPAAPPASVPSGTTSQLPVVTPGAPAPPAAWLDQENTGLGPAPQIAVNRAAKAQRFINRLGGTQNLPTTQAEWEKVAASINEKVPSAETQAQITLGLNKLMRAGAEKQGSLPAPDSTEIPNWIKNAKDPMKALKAAEKLKQAIQ